MSKNGNTIITGGGRGGGTRDIVFRGERTNPKEILMQCAGLAFAGAVLTWAIVAIAMFWVYRPFRWLNDVWRWPASVSVGFLALAAFCGLWALFIEIFDPMHPGTRNPVSTSKPIFPWSKEQGNTGYDQYQKETFLVNRDDYTID